MIPNIRCQDVVIILEVNEIYKQLLVLFIPIIHLIFIPIYVSG